MTRSEEPAEPVLGVLIGHGQFPGALLKAASDIVGNQGDVTVISNEYASGADMETRLARVVDAHPGRRFLVLVDFFGSGCANVSARIRRQHRDRVAVVCGVNLPMLIRFLSYRSRLRLKELAELMVRTGREESRTGPD